MTRYSFGHLAVSVLHRDAVLSHDGERAKLALAVAHVGEIDARRSYREAGYASMFAFCEKVLKLQEQVALKRLRVARIARRFPVIFESLASGALSLTSVIILKPHLTEETASELIAAAANKSTSQVDELLKSRCPRQDLAAKLEPLPAPPPMLGDEVSAQTPRTPPTDELSAQTPCTAADDQLSSQDAATPAPRSKVSPLAEYRFAFQVTVSQRVRYKFRYAQELLSHQLPSGDMAEVLERALDALIAKQEQRKFGATPRPRTATSQLAQNTRHIPAHVKREVWRRDGARCTFVSDDGHRCEERKFLEFDHVIEVARGGRASVSGIRLRCRTHNQFTAECTFGAEFMSAKREVARRAAKERRAATDRSDGEGAGAMTPGAAA